MQGTILRQYVEERGRVEEPPTMDGNDKQHLTFIYLFICFFVMFTLFTFKLVARRPLETTTLVREATSKINILKLVLSECGFS